MVFLARRGQDASLNEAWLDAAGAVDRGKLQLALDGGNIKVVSQLLARKHGPSLASDPLEDGQIPIFVALELLGRSCGPSPRTVVDIVTLLLEKRAEANSPFPPMDESPLQIVLRMDGLANNQSTPELHHWACMRAVVVLLEHKADPNHQDGIGEGPLAEAAVAGNLEACVLLLSHGASPGLPNQNGRRPLDLDIPTAARALLEGGGEDLENFDAGFLAVGSEDIDESENTLQTNSLSVANAVIPRIPEFEEGPNEEIDAVSLSNYPPEGEGGAEEISALHVDSAGALSEMYRCSALADQHFRAKGYAEARDAYKEALQQDPQNASLWSNKAAACMMLGDYQQALNDSSEGVKSDFTNARVHERCAKCMLLLGKLEQAVKFCQLRVDYMEIEEFNRPTNGWRAFLQTANRVSHHHDVLGQIDEILCDHRNSENLLDAEKCVSSILEMTNQLVGAELRSPWGRRLGLTKVKALLFPFAGKCGQKSEDRLAWGQQGLQEVERLVVMDSSDSSLHHWKGRALLRLSRRTEARESLHQALRCAGGKHQASQELLMCLETAEKEKDHGKNALARFEYKESHAHYDVAVRADRLRPDPNFSATLLCNRSAALHKRGGPMALCGALEDVNAALMLSPCYPKALIRRGLICFDQEGMRVHVLPFMMPQSSSRIL
jgi:tetratricopeptide (TPR) repeat protein